MPKDETKMKRRKDDRDEKGTIPRSSARRGVNAREGKMKQKLVKHMHSDKPGYAKAMMCPSDVD